jgi:hypothetical protein
MFRLFLLVGLTACRVNVLGPNDGPPADEEDTPPGIEIVSPADGEGAYGGQISLGWAVEGIALDAEAIGRANEEGHGHVHVYLDGVLTRESGAEEVLLDDLAVGTHTVEVRLAKNNHDELDAADEADIPVADPSLMVTSPSDGSALVHGNTPLDFTIDGFTLNPEMGGDDVFGEGHFIVLVDGVEHDRGVDPLHAQAPGLLEGTHTVRTELVSNLGVPLDPPVFDEIGVDVMAGSPGVYFDRAAFAGTYDSATVPIGISVANFTLVPPSATPVPVDGEGNYHLFLDGVWQGTASAEPSQLFQNMPAGDHVFEVRLASNDAIERSELDRLWVSIPADRPDVHITFPGATWKVASNFSLTYEAENFTLDAHSMDGPNVHHTGHAQLLIDGVLYQESASTTIPVNGLALGSHTLRVQLANNDRTPVDPPVYNEFDVTVQ